MTDIAAIARQVLLFYARGRVVHGFGRGSKELGIPTANFPDDVVENLPEELTCGVYCGFASVNDGPVYPMVRYYTLVELKSYPFVAYKLLTRVWG